MRCRGRRSCETAVQPLCQERADDPGEHVAGARGRERREARHDQRLLARRRDDRPVALEEHDAPESLDGAPARLEPVRVDPGGVDVEHAPELARVRRQHRRRRTCERLQVEERVRVDDRRQVGFLEQPAHELLRAVRPAETRPDRERARARRGIPDLLERTLHGLEQLLLDHRKRRARRRDRHVSRIRTERCARRETRRAGESRRSADDEYRAGGVLRVARRA